MNQDTGDDLTNSSFWSVIILGILTTISAFPTGLLPLVYAISTEGMREKMISAGWMPGNIYHIIYIVLCAGVVSVKKAKKMAQWAFGFLVILCVLNIGGCAVMWNNVSNIGR